MNKELEYVRNQITKLKDDLQHYTMVEKDSVLASQIKYDLDMFCSIEKELKQAEENEKVLNICKNALTIEHHDLSMADLHDDSEDIVAYFVRQFFTIKQNELDKSLRQSLREWVLKNAFPKELKALEIISEAYGNYANHKISEYELIMTIGENTTY